MITPELPRAPISAPNAAAAATRSAETVGPSASASASAARTVAIMFEPVSPSGTGKTFSALTSSTLASSAAAAARKAPRRPAPSHASTGHQRPPSGSRAHQATSVPLSARSDGPSPLGGLRLRRLAAGVELELGDADRQVIDLAPECRPDRVADREIDLARDLADRQAVGDAQVHADPERAVGDGDAQAAGPLLDPAEDAVCPVAGEARDAVRPERHATHDVDDRAPRDERPPGDGWLRHRPSSTRPARRPGAPGVRGIVPPRSGPTGLDARFLNIPRF